MVPAAPARRQPRDTGSVVRRPSTLAITVSCRRSRCGPPGPAPESRRQCPTPGEPVIPPRTSDGTMPYGFTGSACRNSGVFTPDAPGRSVGSGRADSRAGGQPSGGRWIRWRPHTVGAYANPDVDVDEAVRSVRGRTAAMGDQANPVLWVTTRRRSAATVPAVGAARRNLPDMAVRRGSRDWSW